MYLETILLLSKKDGEARITDIAAEMNVAKSSVHIAMHTLSDKGFLKQEKYGAVNLTESGKTYAADIYSRHELLTAFFIDVIGVDTATAEKDACAIEHIISAEAIDKIKGLMKERKN